MKNPFVYSSTNKFLNRGKNLAFDEAFLGLEMEEAEVMDEEREQINYRVLGLIIFLCLSVLSIRILYLQGVKGSEYRALAEGNKLRTQFLLAPRGLLLDRNDKIIASNRPSFELVAITADFPKDKIEFDGRLTQIASILGVDTNLLSQTVQNLTPDLFSAQTLVQNISKEQALVLIAKQEDLKGFAVQNNPIRDYKDPAAVAHLTGYTGKITADELKENSGKDYILNDYIGKTGIEVQYEEYLRGILGKKQAEVDAEGVYKKTLAEVPAIPGSNVKLNIDFDLQKVIYDSMVAMLCKTGTKRGAAVATNPQTGEILALISLPGFDTNLFAHGIKNNEYSALINDENNPLLNRVVSGTYPPGSTIKPAMALAALSEGTVNTETKILDNGVIRVGAFTFYGYEREGLGLMDIYSAIARSSDIYFYTVGGGNTATGFKGMGPDKIASWFRKLNLGSTLGIDLPSEKPGLVPDTAWKERVKKEPWYFVNTYHMSIGQGDVLTTPLQVNNWTATIANGGKIMQPYLLNEVVEHNTGKVLAKGEPKILSENIFNSDIVKVVQEGMRQTVLIGSGRGLLNVGVEVAGKTGTAQFDARDLNRTHAWWTSYAPYSDPQIAFTVIMEGAGEGHAVAVPIAKDMYTWWAQNRFHP